MLCCAVHVKAGAILSLGVVHDTLLGSKEVVGLDRSRVGTLLDLSRGVDPWLQGRDAV